MLPKGRSHCIDLRLQSLTTLVVNHLGPSRFVTCTVPSYG